MNKPTDVEGASEITRVRNGVWKERRRQSAAMVRDASGEKGKLSGEATEGGRVGGCVGSVRAGARRAGSRSGASGLSPVSVDDGQRVGTPDARGVVTGVTVEQ